MMKARQKRAFLFLEADRGENWENHPVYVKFGVSLVCSVGTNGTGCDIVTKILLFKY